MKKLVLAFFSFLFAASAFAQSAEGQCKEYALVLDGPYQRDYESLCRDVVQKLNESDSYSYDYLGADVQYCRIARYNKDRTFQFSNIQRPFFGRDCSDDNKCAAKKGKLTWQYVPMGKIKVVDLEKGTYDFKRTPPPPKVCFDDCEAVSPGKFIGRLGASGLDFDNPDSDGYYTTFANYEYTFSGNLCIEGEHNTPGKPPEKLPENDEEKCKGKGGYFGQVNGKDVCLGVDDQNKCLPGQTYGLVNGKEVCLTPEGEKLPVPEPGNGNDNSNQPGTGNGQGTGPGGNGNGQGNGQGSGGGGGGGGKGNGEGDGEGDGAGPSFGERPGLYEPKYKNGIKGVWNEKKGQLQNSGLGRLSKRLMPTVNSGTCPRWDVDLNFGRNMNFGTKNVAPPCSIWPILRAIVMVCALILARKLVFGG